MLNAAAGSHDHGRETTWSEASAPLSEVVVLAKVGAAP
jgi:hypothetical protein